MKIVNPDANDRRNESEFVLSDYVVLADFHKLEAADAVGTVSADYRMFMNDEVYFLEIT